MKRWGSTPSPIKTVTVPRSPTIEPTRSPIIPVVVTTADGTSTATVGVATDAGDSASPHPTKLIKLIKLIKAGQIDARSRIKTPRRPAFDLWPLINEGKQRTTET